MKKLILIFIIILFSSNVFYGNGSRFYLYHPTMSKSKDTTKYTIPLEVGNTYQYFNKLSSTYSLQTIIIKEDSIINNKRYFLNFPLYESYPVRYDKDSNALYLHSLIDKPLVEFSTPNGDYFNYQGVFSTQLQKRRIFLFSDSINIADYQVGTSIQKAVQYYYADNCGLFEKYIFASGYYTRLIRAILYDSTGNSRYLTDSSKCVITPPVLNTYNRTHILVTSIVAHNLFINRAFGHTDHDYRNVMVDSVWFEYYYNKGVNKTEIKKVNLPHSADSTYERSIVLIRSYLNDGYDLIYRIVAKDKSLIPAISYTEWMKALNNPVSVEDENYYISYSLKQNYPNPFNPVTKISYSIEKQSNVVVKVFDVLGNEIYKLVDEPKESGYYSVDFDASKLASGIYYYSINAGEFNSVKKMVLIK